MRGSTTVDALEGTDEELLLRYGRTGDDEALGALVTRHWPRTWRLAQRTLGDGALAEDVAQEAFVNLARHAGRFSRGRAFAPWLHSITSNAVKNAARGRARRRLREDAWRPDPRDAAPEPDEAEGRARRAGALQAELRELSPKLRDAVVLRHLEGLSLEETAARLDCPVGTVSSRLRRGLEQLEQGLARRGVASVALPRLLEALAGRRLRAPAAPAVASLVALAAPCALSTPALAALALALVALVGGGLAVSVGASTEPAPPVAAAPPARPSAGEVVPATSAGPARASTVAAPAPTAPPVRPAPARTGAPPARPAPDRPATELAATPAAPALARSSGFATPEAVWSAAQAAYETGDLPAYMRLLTRQQQSHGASTALSLATTLTRGDPERAAKLRVALERAGIASLDEHLRPASTPGSDVPTYSTGAEIEDPLALLLALHEADPRALQFVGFPSVLDHPLRHLTVLRDQASARAGELRVELRFEEGGWRLGALGGGNIQLVPRKPAPPPPPPPPAPPLAMVPLVEHRGEGYTVRAPAGVERHTDSLGDVLADGGVFLRVASRGDLPATIDALRAEIVGKSKAALELPLVERPLADGVELEQRRPDRAYVWVLRRGKAGSFVARASGRPEDLEALRAVAESLQVP